jgi:hypothetical protein
MTPAAASCRRTPCRRPVLLLLLCWLLLTSSAAPSSANTAPAQTRWGFSLPAQAITSAGVYDPDGKLVRTLWRAETFAAGRHSGGWDGLDDQGHPTHQTNHEIRLIYHRINYVWEGVYGNSSAAVGGPDVHKAYLPPTSLVLDGERVIYSVGYNEGQPGLHSFPAAAPEQHALPFPSVDPFASFSMIAVDAQRLYWANTGGMSRTSFVGVFDLRSARPAQFSAGVAVCLTRRQNGKCYEPQDYRSVVSVETHEAMAPTGLAVERNGRVLAVSHGGVGRVRLFDKTSGDLLNEIQLPLAAKKLNQLAMTPGGDLWVISGRKVLRYTNLADKPTLVASIDGLVQPVAVATHPTNDDELWVADGGTSQQLKRFDSEGKTTGVIGLAGGYSQSPEVSPDRLCFRSRDGQEQTAILPLSDATLWVVDYCNNRMLRFRIDRDGASARNDAQIAYLPGFYASTVDHANPRRVFANFLEFETDPDIPPHQGQAWKLVRNWLGGLPASLVDRHAFNASFGGFQTVETLANGRSYGMLRVHGRQALVELPASGPLRVLKIFGQPLPGATPVVMYENGDLGHAITGASSQSAMRLPLTGFDEQGDPVWASEPVTLATVPLLPGSPHYRGAFSGMPPRFPVTGSGKVVFFDQSVVGNEGFHLGAAAVGGKGWLWQASPSGALDGKGSFQTKAVDGSTHYGGNVVWAHGRHIVYGYHGEFHKDLQTGKVGQANQFMHFDESGLFLGQFGQRSTRPAPPSQAGMSGNAFSPTLVRVGNRLYLYHNDESTHGGVHRWRIDGWDDVRELRGTGPIGGSIELR